MILMGFITVLEWDALFPDRRDYLILAPLPVRLPTLFTAKITALFLFLLVFTLALNGCSSILFPLMAMNPHAPTGYLLRYIGCPCHGGLCRERLCLAVLCRAAGCTDERSQRPALSMDFTHRSTPPALSVCLSFLSTAAHVFVRERIESRQRLFHSISASHVVHRTL